jgi:EAL domain-containing protein (putative c-di-GMP-specific phosphodiesterase class I)
MAEECDAVAIAEGIETAEDLRVLVDLGVPLGQGFLLGHPAPHREPAGAARH